MPYQFTVSDGPEPHIGRTKQILLAHPEVRTLFGNTPKSFAWAVGIVLFQIFMATFFAGWGFFGLLFLAFTFGATANHALFVLIHEATHNLIFKSSRANKLAGIFCNLPIVFPSAIGFRNFHLLHHRYQGELDFDADLASPKEAAFFSKSPLHKTLWLLVFSIIEGVVRPMRVKKFDVKDTWVLLNIAVQVVFVGLMFAFAGWGAVLYLTLSMAFSVGLHPFGARWIQEHYIVKKGQETYSYYGPLNNLMFNVGYHNEHHDLMMVPWSRLKDLKRMAPEFYEPLYAHYSYVGLLFKFIFDPNLNLFSRVIRTAHHPQTKINGATVEAGVAASIQV